MKNRTKIDDKGREKKKERQNGLECRPSWNLGWLLIILLQLSARKKMFLYIYHVFIYTVKINRFYLKPVFEIQVLCEPISDFQHMYEFLFQC